MTSKNLKTWKSPKVLNKASSAEKNLATQQAGFYQTLTQDYGKQFANQSNVLASLQSAWNPILQAGPGQYGFTPQEDASLRTSSADSIAQGQLNAQKALNNTLAAEGGGNSFIPNGAQEQLKASLLSSAGQQQAASQNQITQAGYQTGLQNFNNASSALGGVAGQYAPTGYISGANSAGGEAFSSANAVNTQNNAWKSSLMGAIGGIGGAILGGPIGAGIGESFGSALGGGSNYSAGDMANWGAGGAGDPAAPTI